MNIRSYSFEEFVEKVRVFHGYGAPGVIIGGFMVDLAYRYLPKEGLFDALCETQKCLPDAVQLLTPCTVGNSWLVVVNLGRYALILYDKSTGEGVRVSIDPAKLEAWPEIKAWFFKLKRKKEQNVLLLMKEIEEAGSTICKVQRVKVADRVVDKPHRKGFTVCPRCKESYPIADGSVCLGCQNAGLYEVRDEVPNDAAR
jgi:formylmethanofuran dehydrogenase subunit E